MVKKIRSKGTSNVLQGGGVSEVQSKTTFLHFFLGPFPKHVTEKSKKKKKAILCLSINILRMLLVIGGVEMNPGPFSHSKVILAKST